MAGILSSLSRSFSAPEVRDKVNPKHPRDPALATMFGDGSGVSVSPESAMRVTAVYACVALISETLAGLPLHVYRRTGDSRERATDHPLYRLIHDSPSEDMTSFEFWEMQISHVCLRGDAYSIKNFRGDGSVRSLQPVLPYQIRPFVSERNGRVMFSYQPMGGGKQRIFFPHEILRIPHKMMDGVNSLSPVQVHKTTIGNAMMSARYLKSFYENSATPKGALMFSELLSNEAAAAARRSFEERHQGPENSGRVGIFDGGMKWEPIGMTMDDAQYIDLQEFSVSDIARIYLVPPHKIGDLSKATFSNIEQQSISFVVDTVLRWVRRIESRLNMSLLSEADRAMGNYIAYDMKGLLRGDSAARGNFYRALFYIGAISPNEIRAAEDMNPYEGGGEYYVQGATTPIAALDALTGAGAPKGGLDDRVKTMIDDAVNQMVQDSDQKGTENE